MEVDYNRIGGRQSMSESSASGEHNPELRERIILHLSNCNDIYFKSQQIGDPELSVSEKRAILEDVLTQNRSTFLSRFGHRLLKEHLSFFNTPADIESYEVQFYLSKLKGRNTAVESNVQVKNRRFQAMKKLMSEGEYFSVSEMRKRNPLLFDQLLGNFVKNPKVELDYDQEYQIAHILLDQFEQDQVAALKKSQLEVEMEQAEADSSSDDAFEDDEGYSTKETIQSTSFHTDQVDRALWGSTYRSDPVIGRTRWKNKHSGKENDTVAESTLSPEEKLLLINEFTSSMFSSFLLGNDDFDYSEVDNNPDYDDINQREIDEQEKYFDSESPQEAEYYGVQSGGNELDQLYQDFNQEIKSEKLTNEFKHMNTREKSTSNNDSL